MRRSRQVPEVTQAAEEVKKLRGNWTFVTMERGGKKAPEQLLATPDDTLATVVGGNVTAMF